MATVPPPPSKRQKRAALERSQFQQDVAVDVPLDASSFKARFVDGDGNQMTDVIEIPLIDASEKNVSLLLNTLLVCTHVECEDYNCSWPPTELTCDPSGP